MLGERVPFLIQLADFRNITDRIGASALQMCHLVQNVNCFYMFCSVLF